MAQESDSQHNRNRTLAEHFAELLFASIPSLEKDIETIRQTVQALAPYAVLFLKYLQELPEINRKALIKLAKIGWFPGLGLPLDNLQEILRTVSADRDRAEKIAIDFLRERVDAIELELSQSYPERSHLFRDAFQAHRERKYNLAIPVLLAQSDGIFWEASSKSLFKSYERKSVACKYKRNEAPGGFLEAMLTPLSISSPLWMNQHERSESFEGLNRHQVLHGEAVTFGTEINSLKAISSLSYLRCILNRS